MTQPELQQLLARWRRDPIAFITEALVDPETGEPFVLYPAQERFLREALTPTPDGRLRYAELVYGAPKKSGKTAVAAMAMIYIVVVLGGPYAEGYCVANDFEQAATRVFQAVSRIIQSSPMLQSSAKVTNSYIEFPSTGATIQAISTDYASAAGANPTCVTFDELWGYVSESAQRLWDELVPVPTRKVSVRLTTTYGGFEGESELLERLYNRGLKSEEIAPCLYRQPGMLMAWHHQPIAPWQSDEWLAQMREQLRPNAYLRMIENRFVSSESTFIPPEWWTACTDADAKPIFSAARLPIWIGVDASLRRDSTALVAVTLSQGILAEQVARDRNRFAAIPDIARLQRLDDLQEHAESSPMIHLVNHRIFRPQGETLDFEATIERTLYEWSSKYTICGVLFDPYQMISLAQRLGRAGFPMYPFDQTIPALTESSNNLYELLKSGSIRAYPDPELKQAIGWAVAKENTRGWRIAKEKASHHIDVVVALAFAALAAVKYGPGWFAMNRSSGSSTSEEFVTSIYSR